MLTGKVIFHFMNGLSCNHTVRLSQETTHHHMKILKGASALTSGMMSHDNFRLSG